LKDAVVLAKTAQALDRFSPTFYSDSIRSLYYAGRLDEARRESLKLFETDLGFARAYYELGLVLEEEGKLEEAINEFKLGLKQLPDNVTALTALGHAQARAGRRADAEKVIARLQELSKRQYVSPFQTAVVYAGMDERKLALDWLEKSRDERFNWLPFIKVDPVFKNLRAEPRFVELAKGLGLTK
jgi:tetratricopeptide (TPR) repeat protein